MSILFCLAAYLYGALPFGYLLVRFKKKQDIRGMGSRSTGATNVLRTAGWAAALPVVFADLSKGFLPLILGRHWFPEQPLIPMTASLAAVLGHCYPVTLRFRGGKGVAASLGAFLALGLIPFLLSLAVFVAAIALTRFVSLGSLLAVALFPFLRLALSASDGILTWAWWGAILIIVVIRHKENIRGLSLGQERRLGRRTVEAED
ncbi:MAG: acyl-phosphate glycerol 3-phosphate acyltransferase [Candidatus Aminicenantes bacterium RBG_13_63_10]|nr:MAG: acyl-phosphate glycerol 3-phosphate acyltransferase [Candidatus Aminicenantes bacterium RBG_13_63_10]